MTKMKGVNTEGLFKLIEKLKIDDKKKLIDQVSHLKNYSLSLEKKAKFWNRYSLALSVLIVLAFAGMTYQNHLHREKSNELIENYRKSFYQLLGDTDEFDSDSNTVAMQIFDNKIESNFDIKRSLLEELKDHRSTQQQLLECIQKSYKLSDSLTYYQVIANYLTKHYKIKVDTVLSVENGVKLRTFRFRTGKLDSSLAISKYLKDHYKIDSINKRIYIQIPK